MATITPTFSKLRGPAGGIDAVVVTWTPLTTANTVGVAFARSDLDDRSVQFTGTFGGSSPSFVFEASNDGINFFTLSNPFGTSLTFASANLLQTNAPAAWVRPRLASGGDGTTAVTVTLTARRTLR